MEYRQQLCTTHGGYFSIPVKRGRPPVKCSSDNTCDRYRNTNRVVTKDNTATATEKRRAMSGNAPRKPRAVRESFSDQIADTRRSVREGKKYQSVKTAATPAVVTNNLSVPLTFHAKRVLEPEGWQCKGRAWADTEGRYASLLAQRGQETISFLWKDGKLVSQQYSMWNTDKPVENGMPTPRLEFDPDDLTDAALVKYLAGRKVTWWNRLGKNTETVHFPKGSEKKIKVEHLMDGNGDNENRIVTFVDQEGSGFRSFNVNALLKVV